MNFCEYSPMSPREIMLTLKSEKVCQLGTMNSINIEIVPMWYTVNIYKNKLFFYFISINSGTKMNNMKDTGIVCVSVTNQASTCCNENYKSIVANGNASIVTDCNERSYINKLFINKYGSSNIYNSCTHHSVEYIKVCVKEITGRHYY